MSKLSLTEIAKLVRSDIAAAVKAGELPKGIKVSVRGKHFSMGCSLNVAITALPAGVPVLNAAHVKWHKENPHAGMWNLPAGVRERHAPEATAVLAKVEAIVDAYHTSRRHEAPNDDIVDVNFYKHVDISHELEGADRARIEAELAAAKTAAEAAPVAPAATRAAVLPRYFLRADGVFVLLTRAC